MHQLRQQEQGGQQSKPKRPRAVVLGPTRELTDQILQVAKSLCHHARFRSACVNGGAHVLQPLRMSCIITHDASCILHGRHSTAATFLRFDVMRWYEETCPSALNWPQDRKAMHIPTPLDVRFDDSGGCCGFCRLDTSTSTDVKGRVRYQKQMHAYKPVSVCMSAMGMHAC